MYVFTYEYCFIQNSYCIVHIFELVIRIFVAPERLPSNNLRKLEKIEFLEFPSVPKGEDGNFKNQKSRVFESPRPQQQKKTSEGKIQIKIFRENLKSVRMLPSRCLI